MRNLYFILMLFLVPIHLTSQETILKETKTKRSNLLKESYTVLETDDRIKHGSYTSYYTNGNVSSSGFYDHDLKDGEWSFYSRAGRWKETRFYTLGKKSGIWRTMTDSKVVVKRYDYDKNEIAHPFVTVFPKYPALARENGVEGTVKVKIIFGEACAIEKINIVEGVDSDCNSEAIKAVKEIIRLMTKYAPEGCPTEEYDYDILFKLN